MCPDLLPAALLVAAAITEKRKDDAIRRLRDKLTSANLADTVAQAVAHRKEEDDQK